MTAPGGIGGAPRRVLIYRLGSLGDTLVALPAIRLVARAFEGAERRVLTNLPISTKAAPMQAVLGSSLVDGWFTYPVGLRRAPDMLRLRREIAAWGPDIAVYLAQPRGRLKILRDCLFLRASGARRVIGVPLAADLIVHRRDPANGLMEREASRLARCLAPLGDAKVDNPASRAVGLTAGETSRAGEFLAGWPGATRFVGFSVGTKRPEKDWGDGRWRGVLRRLGTAQPGLGLAVVGVAEEQARSASLARAWPGPVLDLCGRVSVRESAALMARAALFMGHDSGVMHLAAAVGCPCVAVFSRRDPPGLWFPLGEGHRVFYPGLAWSGGTPPVMRDAKGERNIADIDPAGVVDAAASILARRATAG